MAAQRRRALSTDVSPCASLMRLTPFSTRPLPLALPPSHPTLKLAQYPTLHLAAPAMHHHHDAHLVSYLVAACC